MNKYTRREFFKSIIPMSAGIVLFPKSNSPENSQKLNLLIDNVVTNIDIDDYVTTKNWAGDVIKQKWPEFISVTIQNHLDLDGWHIIDK